MSQQRAHEDVARIIPRWEWRIFMPAAEAGVLPAIVGALAHGGVASPETYILSLASPHNVKVRDGRLEIKRLESSEHGLERWKPTLKAEFPVDAAAIAAAWAAWGLTGPAPAARSTTFEQFIRGVVTPQPDLRALMLVKRRTRIQVEGCAGESAELQLDGQTWHTTAFEDPDPAVVWRAVRHLGLEHHRNTSYPAALKHIVAFTNRSVLVGTEEEL